MTAETGRTDWLARYGPAVTRHLLGGAPAPGPIEVVPLRETRDTRVMAFRAGARALVAKAFAPHRPQAAERFEREGAMLMRLAGSGLAPRLLGVNGEECVLLIEEVRGTRLDRHLTDRNAPEIAGRLGRWYGGFAQRQDRHPAGADWLSYLARYPGVIDDTLSPETRRFLGTLPPPLRSIARNDAHLSNFVVTPSGTLLGLDFEAALIKPLGWDLLLAARDLARRAPAATPEIIERLAAGWEETGAGGPEGAALRRLLAFFVARTAPQDSTDTEARRAQNARRLARAGLGQDDAVFSAPHLGRRLVPLPRRAAALIRAHVRAALAAAPEPAGAAVAEDREAPHLDALCGTCNGYCCKDGYSRGAYLTPEDLARVRRDFPALGPGALAGRYVAHLPETHVEGSCMYHGAEGCTLPRRLRASVCNGFRCRTARALDDFAAAQPGAMPPVLLLAEDRGQVARAAVFRAGKARPVDPDALDEA
jgi:hypothetical protein